MKGTVGIDVMCSGKNVRYYRLGRHALLFGLKLLRVGPGDVVLVPAYICRDVLAPVHTVGAVPKFYPVDRELRPVDLPDAENVRAVLAVNYFGFPQNLAPFRDYCLCHNAVLIEDNAHGFLSQDTTGTFLGERGDLSIFSPHKTLLLPDGAFLLVNRPEWQCHVEKQLPCCSKFLPMGYWIRYALSKLQGRTGLNVMTMARDMVRSVRYFCTGYEVPLCGPESEFLMPAEPRPHRRSLSMLFNLNMADEIARRRTIYEKVRRLLVKEDIEPIFNDLPKGVVPYGYPFYADCQSAERVKKISRSLGMDCINWPDLPSEIKSIAPEHYISVWLINFI